MSSARDPRAASQGPEQYGEDGGSDKRGAGPGPSNLNSALAAISTFAILFLSGQFWKPWTPASVKPAAT